MNDLISRKALLAEYDRVHIGKPGKARKLIVDAPAVREWIPVSERLPRLESYTYSVDVLFYERKDGIHVGYACLETGVWKDRYSRDLYADFEVTHWMPLPEMPKGE